MKTKEFASMTDVELSDKLASLKAELFNLRFAHATNSLANPMQLKTCKRDIAKVKTIIRERELNIAKAPVAAVKESSKKATTKAKAVKG